MDSNGPDLPGRNGPAPPERPSPTTREPCCLGGEPQLPNILQNPPNGLRREAHSSIRIQEGEPEQSGTNGDGSTPLQKTANGGCVS
jgi:hypothetical protein